MNSASNALRSAKPHRRLTQDEMRAWLAGQARPQIFTERPFALVECDCGDLNCRGWRLQHIPSRVSGSHLGPELRAGRDSQAIAPRASRGKGRRREF